MDKILSVGKSVSAIVSGLAILCLTGCEGTLAAPDGIVGIRILWLILAITGLMCLVALPVFILTFRFAWRFRQSAMNETRAARPLNEALIEKLVWIVPVCLVAIMAVINWISTHRLDPYRAIDPQTVPLQIDVIAADWKWVFIYPTEGLATVNEIAIPVGQPVEFRITSNTVMNSFFIPALGSQIYAMAGMETKLYLLADAPADLEGISANFSGRGFSDMRFGVRALEPAAYRDWLEEVRKSDRALDAARWKELASPSENVAVTYFGSVDATLFESVVDEYDTAGRSMPGMAEKVGR